MLPHLISRAPKVALLQQADSKGLAEREGFEPPIPFRVCRFSRPVPSTTRPPLRNYSFTAARVVFARQSSASLMFILHAAMKGFRNCASLSRLPVQSHRIASVPVLRVYFALLETVQHSGYSDIKQRVSANAGMLGA